MQLYSGTGVLKTPELSITKSTGTLLFEISKSVANLTNETISIWIERPVGGNIHLATRVNLKQFLLLHVFNGRNAIQSGFGNGNIVVVDLGLEAAILLGANERIKILVEGLISTDTYTIDYLEDFEATTSYAQFEPKTVLTDEIDKEIDVNGYEMVVFKKPAALTEVGITYAVGTEKRFTPRELHILSIEANPLLSVSVGGAVSMYDTDFIVMPLIGIRKLRFYKTTAASVPMLLMKYSEIVPGKSKM